MAVSAELPMLLKRCHAVHITSSGQAASMRSVRHPAPDTGCLSHDLFALYIYPSVSATTTAHTTTTPYPMSSYGYAAAPGYHSPYLTSRPMDLPPPPHIVYLSPYPAPEVGAYNHYATYDEMNARHRPLTRPQQPSRSRRSKSARHEDHESRQFLDVQPTPVNHRRSASQSHRRAHSRSSRSAPELTHSDDESEGRPVSGPTTPYSANVALWRDDVMGPSEDAPGPPPLIIPPHIKGQYDFATNMTRHSSPTDYAFVIPPSLPPSPSPPAYDSVPVVDLERTRAEIEDIDYEVNSRILAFAIPTTLDLHPQLPGGSPSALPYTPRNKGLIEHRDYLEKTLSRLDAIDSHRDQRVRSLRKRVVNKIQEQLEQLHRMEKMVRDNMHYARWKKTPRIQVTAP